MGKFSGLLICSDFDGTVAHGAKVSRRNAEAIRYFQEHGGLFTLATGRYPTIVRESNADFSCNTHLIALNGTLMYDGTSNRTSYECLMAEDYTEALFRIVREYDGIRDVMFFPRTPWKSCAVSPKDEQTLLQCVRQSNYKLVIHVDAEQSDAIKERMISLSGDSFAVCRSWIHGIEVHNSACDKGKTARRLAKLVGADQLIGVGDYENDLPLLREADVGYAMGNAVESLKQIADFVTDSVENDGLASLIYNL